MKIIEFALRKNEIGTPFLLREKSVTLSEYKQLKHSEDIFYVMEKLYHLSELVQEKVYMVALDNPGNVKGIFLVSAGGMDYSFIDPKILFMQVLLCNATHFVLIHNHPSGELVPSYEDMEFTKQVKKAGEVMDIKLSDHIIIGNNNYYSFLDNKIL